MTTDSTPPIFGPSAVIDPATYTPRSGKTFVLQEALRRFPPSTPLTAEVVLGNCTTSLPFKFEFDPKDNGHTLMLGTTREGMSGRSVLSPFARDVFLALGSQREAAESNGISLATLSMLLGMKSTPEGDREIVDALRQIGHLVPGLRYSEADGLVRAGDVHQ
jgi:hypothetical protein